MLSKKLTHFEIEKWKIFDGSEKMIIIDLCNWFIIYAFKSMMFLNRTSDIFLLQIKDI